MVSRALKDKILGLADFGMAAERKDNQ